MLNAIEAARRIGEGLDEDSIPYAIGGALALGVWGAPRATKDVDLSVFVRRDELGRVLDSLERVGVMISREQAAKDVARIGLAKGRLGMIVVDVFLSEHPQYLEMARRARRVVDPATGWSASFISAEDLCIHKLVFGRHKDIGDLESLFAVRRDLDLAYVRGWLVQMVPHGDARLTVLDDLERRFAPDR
jgi:hypothetical protein